MTVRITALSCIANCNSPVCPSVRSKLENVQVAKNATSNVPKIPPHHEMQIHRGCHLFVVCL